MKRLFFLVLLVFATSMGLQAEAKVVTLPDGTVVFQLDRSDMEKATFALEQVPLLEAEVAKLTEINAKAEDKNAALTTVIWIVSIGGPLVGLIIGLLVRR